MTSSDQRITFVRNCGCGNSIEVVGPVGKPYRQMCRRCGRWMEGKIEGVKSARPKAKH